MIVKFVNVVWKSRILNLEEDHRFTAMYARNN